MGKLTDLKVKNAKAGIHGDGGGLYLRVKETGAKSWVLRVQANKGTRADIGLGGYPVVMLTKAREKALELRRIAKESGDVEEARRVHKSKKTPTLTFKDAMLKAHAELSKGLSEKTAAAFKSSLEAHIVPKLGAKRVDQITAADVIAALAATWTEKPAQADKLRIRTMKVLSFAKANGWRKEALPDARELRDGLARRGKGGNFAAVPYRDVPAFVADQLQKDDTAGRLALLFTIFTAARSGEVRSARWEHIDLEGREWNRPAELMKSKVRHTVTLNDAAMAILERAKVAFGATGLIFPGTRKDAELSDMTLSKVLRAAGRTETVHGFRSTFRDWAAEKMPSIPAMVPEMALAHSVGSATQQAYLRSDLRDQRRALMEAWSQFVVQSPVGDNVVQLRA
ncbi:tyrosine-type recombinase/integrase [Sphingomonas aracearum]|uniref:Site-specific integrase n=1 Tax=Sphingomonas aracearum TaxID=2283317 RepID=A0A369VV76_9SPHN|nr:site-specific integrase [Sphingomonas aracearum]RDE06238.1 site-specific integrase [Sphingomonas aracearum]